MNWLERPILNISSKISSVEIKKGLIRIFLGNKTESSINATNSNGHYIAIIFPKVSS